MIRPFTLKEIAECLNGQVAGESQSVAIDRVSIDTRSLTGGELFVAIKGPHFDGHDFLPQAEQAGAAAVVVEVLAENCRLPQIRVADTFKTLGQLGKLNRDQFQGLVTAITGSCGKTSVKEMLAAVLAEQSEVWSTRGNLNNGYGVPLTLLEISEKHHKAVIELGTSSPGEIEYIAQLAKPDISVITNAAEAHLEELGSVAGVAHEKGYILDSLDSGGIAVLNRDDAFYQEWYDRVLKVQGRSVMSFSVESTEADVFASEIETTEQGMRFKLNAQGQVVPVTLAFWGRHQVLNACCAAAAALAGGTMLDIVVRGLENARPYQRRGLRYQVSRGGRKLMIFDETYNANPKATLAAIEHLSGYNGLKIMAFGDMLELGSVAEARHRDMGLYAKEVGIDYFAGFGTLANLACQAFGKGGCHFEDKTALTEWIGDLINKGSDEVVSVLVKGSRGMGMLDVVRSLVGPEYKGER
ncbi:UDP-N-acetylmuramoyl-tripeptide--D-alanyl-D-alanine ligase [Endozoicomonas sp. Mp262]|uniref:UDP-N-acetylmuramoyl-tripeptide--D-alanyl-D- alanine ligase n=1 Tax=Endozoicomonas sp. Mp262 TaxID=2919499 RepID=UPI0021D87608